MRRSEIYFVSVIVLSLASLVQNIAGTLPASYFSFYARAGLHKVSKSLLDESENQKNNALSEEGSWMIKAVWGITFCVSDLARAKKFYTETLGLEKKYEYPSYVGFECGGVEIGLIPRLKKGQKVGPSSPPVEFLVNDAQKVYDELRKKGVSSRKNFTRSNGAADRQPSPIQMATPLR